jgi:hypothetical protein
VFALGAQLFVCCSLWFCFVYCSVNVQYTTSIHELRRQFDSVLSANQKQSRSSSSRGAAGSNSNALALNRCAHVGYILLCTGDGTEVVVEVRFHPQYVDQLVASPRA